VSLYVIALMHIHEAYLDNTLSDTRMQYSKDYLYIPMDGYVSWNANKKTY